MDTAIHNSYILYQRRHNKKSFGEKQFRMELMKQLVGGFSARVAHAHFRKHPRDSLHQLGHGSKQGVCSMCRGRVGDGGHNRRSYWSCTDCDVFLCVPDCYNKHVQTLAHVTTHEDES